MNWKSLIFTDAKDENAKQEEVVQTEAVGQSTSATMKFPNDPTNASNYLYTQNVAVPASNESNGVASSAYAPVNTASVPLENNPMCHPHMEKLMEMYEKGFESLNMEGYDFFEFFKAIVVSGVDNPATYPMAFSMAQSMDKTITKDALIKQSEFYVTEITKVYTQYVESGSSKKAEILNQKETEKQQLNVELQNLKLHIETLTQQMNTAQINLQQIDNKFAEGLTEVDCKIMANDVAKNKILTSINKVKEGLINNVR